MEVTADHSTATGNPDAMDSGEVRGRGRGQGAVTVYWNWIIEWSWNGNWIIEWNWNGNCGGICRVTSQLWLGVMCTNEGFSPLLRTHPLKHASLSWSRAHRVVVALAPSRRAWEG